MPQYYYIKAFMVDEEYNPCGNSYESSLYTKDMQEFLNKTTDDFSYTNKVLNLDDNEETNFAVYANEIKVIRSYWEENRLVSSDEGNNVYIFENIDSDIKELRTGDAISYESEDGNVVLIKIDTITITRHNSYNKSQR